MPTVSIIIPTCTREDLLVDCVLSVLRNDFSDFEILIIDQDPGQRLRARLATLNDSRLRYFYLAEAAASKARNMGLDNARGEIRIFADDDIEVGPGWVRAFVETFSMQPTPGIVAGRLTPRWLAPRPTWLPADQETIFGIYDRDFPRQPLPEADLPILANMAVHRRVITAGMRFDERLDYSYARKNSSLMGGADSLFSLQVKQAKHLLYYQPAAQAWHKISSHKLNWQYFLKRAFWEGFTLLTVLHLSGQALPTHAGAVARWHLRYIAAQWWRLFFPKQRPAPALTHPASWMRVIANCTQSLGTIVAAIRLARTGTLP